MDAATVTQILLEIQSNADVTGFQTSIQYQNKLKEAMRAMGASTAEVDAKIASLNAELGKKTIELYGQGLDKLIAKEKALGHETGDLEKQQLMLKTALAGNGVANAAEGAEATGEATEELGRQTRTAAVAVREMSEAEAGLGALMAGDVLMGVKMLASAVKGLGLAIKENPLLILIAVIPLVAAAVHHFFAQIKEQHEAMLKEMEANNEQFVIAMQAALERKIDMRAIKEAAREAEDAMQHAVDKAKELQAAQDKLEDAKTGKKLADLDVQEQGALANAQRNGATPQQIAQVRAQFAGKREEITDNASSEKAVTALNNAAENVKLLSAQLTLLVEKRNAHADENAASEAAIQENIDAPGKFDARNNVTAKEERLKEVNRLQAVMDNFNLFTKEGQPSTADVKTLGIEGYGVNDMDAARKRLNQEKENLQTDLDWQSPHLKILKGNADKASGLLRETKLSNQKDLADKDSAIDAKSTSLQVAQLELPALDLDAQSAQQRAAAGRTKTAAEQNALNNQQQFAASAPAVDGLGKQIEPILTNAAKNNPIALQEVEAIKQLINAMHDGSTPAQARELQAMLAEFFRQFGRRDGADRASFDAAGASTQKLVTLADALAIAGSRPDAGAVSATAGNAEARTNRTYGGALPAVANIDLDSNDALQSQAGAAAKRGHPEALQQAQEIQSLIQQMQRSGATPERADQLATLLREFRREFGQYDQANTARFVAVEAEVQALILQVKTIKRQNANRTN